MELLLLGLGLCLLVWRLAAAAHAGYDARMHGLSIPASFRWALIASVVPRRYWWGIRLNLLTVDTARALLQRSAHAHGLQSVVNVRCPLCDNEIGDALSVTTPGALAIRPGAKCGRCDFRLDACRHCDHFLPAQDGFTLLDRNGDYSHGRCSVYRAVQPVREVYPDQAQRLESLGYDQLPSPKFIQDSYFPLEECTAFSLNQKRLHWGNVRWLDHQRTALIRLHGKLDADESEELPAD